jgi:hypothetical protein
MRAKKRDLASRKRVRSGRGRRCSQKRQTLQWKGDLRRTFEKLIPEMGTRRRTIEGRPLLFVHLEDIDSSRGELVSKLAQASEREDRLGVERLGESQQKLGRAHASRKSRGFHKDGGAGGALERAPTGEKKRKPEPRRVESAERLDALDRPIAMGPPEARHRARRSEKRKTEIGGDDDRFRAEFFEISRELVQEPAAEGALSSRDEHRRGVPEKALRETRAILQHGYA